MGKFSILLCDSDEVYMKRLAAGLNKLFKEKASVSTITEEDSANCVEHAQLVLTSGGEQFLQRCYGENCTFLHLHEGDSIEDPDRYKESIYKYQSVSRIGRALTKYIPNQQSWCGVDAVGSRQKWYGVISPSHHRSMIPFGISLAQRLSVRKRTLVLIFMEFSGISTLLGLEQCGGIEDFVLALRKAQKEELAEIPLPEVNTLPGIDLLNVTDTPMVLYELTEGDMDNLFQRIRKDQQYDEVVWIAGNMVRGIVELFQESEKVFGILGEDAYSTCCEKEFTAFYKKIGVENGRLCWFTLPDLSDMDAGEHLLLQWSESAIGAAVKRLLQED